MLLERLSEAFLHVKMTFPEQLPVARNITLHVINYKYSHFSGKTIKQKVVGSSTKKKTFPVLRNTKTMLPPKLLPNTVGSNPGAFGQEIE